MSIGSFDIRQPTFDAPSTSQHLNPSTSQPLNISTMKKVLVVNAGSSSLKYMLFDMQGEKMLCKGLVERIGIAGSRLVYSKAGA